MDSWHDVQAYTNIAVLMDALTNTTLLYLTYNCLTFICDTWQKKICDVAIA